jgi:hypothetical protein
MALSSVNYFSNYTRWIALMMPPDYVAAGVLVVGEANIAELLLKRRNTIRAYNTGLYTITQQSALFFTSEINS